MRGTKCFDLSGPTTHSLYCGTDKQYNNCIYLCMISKFLQSTSAMFTPITLCNTIKGSPLTATEQLKILEWKGKSRAKSETTKCICIAHCSPLGENSCNPLRPVTRKVDNFIQ